MAGALARYPLLTVRIMARIYGHALRLRLRGARYFPHPSSKAARRTPRRRSARFRGRTGERPGAPGKLPARLEQPADRERVRLSWRLARRLVIRMLSRIDGGRLVLDEGEGQLEFGRIDPERPLQAVIEVRSPRFYRELLRGSVGLCESYLQGLWECDDLVSMTRIAALNVAGLDRLRRIFTLS